MADYDPDRLMSERPTGTPMMTVRPKRAGPRRDEDDKGEGSALSPTMRQILEHIAGPESGGRYNIIYGGHTFDTSQGHPRIAVPIKEGPNAGKTSSAAGRYQFIGSTWDKVAQKTGRTDMSKESQDINAAQLAKDTYKRQTGRDIEADWSAGSENLRKGIDRALGAEWEAFAKPGPRMDKLDADGKPRYRFSDYAMQEHDGRSNTDLLMMSPQQYLDLSPELEGKPFESPSGRALKKSFDRGDAIEAVPTLDVNVDGPTATVTDQDGRHRALLAQQEGIDAIPVAVRKSGEGEPKEIVGMNGVPMAHDFPKASEVKGRQPQQQTQEQPKEPVSLFGRIGEAIMPSAEAAESNPYAEFAPKVSSDNPYAEFAPKPADGGATQPSGGGIGDTVQAAVHGAAKGFGETVLSGQELVGKGLEAAGVPGGKWLTEDARRGMANLNQEIAPDKAAHPIASGAGEFAGGLVVPGGAAAKLVKPINALRSGAVAGGISGMLSPGSEGNYWGEKALQTGVGAGAGAVAGKLGNALSGLIAPQLRATVAKLMNEGVELTPGQMAGGIARTAEDKAMSIPITGDAIIAARRRGYEQFNRAAWNRVLEPLNEAMPATVKMGRSAAQYVSDRLDAAYGRILPNLRINSLQSDHQFVSDFTRVIQDARAALPDAQFNHFERIARSQLEQKLGPSGTTADGGLINGIDSMLGKEARGYKGDNSHDNRKLGEMIGDLQVAFRDMLERQNPTYRNELQQARRAYANYVRVGRAAAATGTATNEGIFSPAQLNAAVRAEDHSTRKLGYMRGRALLQDLADAGQAVLPSKYPDSGTAGRLMMGGGALGVAELLHHPEAILGLLAGAVPFTAPSSKALNWAVNRLAQPAGPTRNALATMSQGGGQIAAPIAGSAAASLMQPQGNPP